MSDKYPFKLTKSERFVFEAVASGNYSLSGIIRPKIVKTLLERGLIELSGSKIIGKDRFGLIVIPEYSVPLPHHMAWCKWCSENVKDEEQ